MATYVEINGISYPATIGGKMVDKDWNGRPSKSIHLKMNYNEAVTVFIDDIQWNIVQEEVVVTEVEEPILDNNGQEIVDENGNILTTIINKPIIEKQIYDNSEYCIAGNITDHRDGTVTIKMGQPTAEELLAILVGEA